ncbi:XRE family transcriptional regulator [Streptococcus dysgalactiae subsp. dysgalactiae]|nr:XRE family transcriptional regulator [Streptococcus dysgalactiae subsp. dysgalactiae]
MLPERLKKLRLEKNLTQKQVAQRLNITQQAYGQWETGKLNPKKETIQMFADFFNVSTDYLLGKSDQKNPDEINLSDFELLYRKTSGNLSDEQKLKLEKDLKAFLIERKRLLDEKFGKID